MTTAVNTDQPLDYTYADLVADWLADADWKSPYGQQIRATTTVAQAEAEQAARP